MEGGDPFQPRPPSSTRNSERVLEPPSVHISPPLYHWPQEQVLNHFPIRNTSYCLEQRVYSESQNPACEVDQQYFSRPGNAEPQSRPPMHQVPIIPFSPYDMRPSVHAMGQMAANAPPYQNLNIYPSLQPLYSQGYNAQQHVPNLETQASALWSNYVLNYVKYLEVFNLIVSSNSSISPRIFQNPSDVQYKFFMGPNELANTHQNFRNPNASNINTASATAVDVTKLSNTRGPPGTMDETGQCSNMGAPKADYVMKKRSKRRSTEPMNVYQLNNSLWSPTSPDVMGQNSKRRSPETTIITKQKSKLQSIKAADMRKLSNERGSPEAKIVTKLRRELISSERMDLTNQVNMMRLPNARYGSKQSSTLGSPEPMALTDRISEIGSPKVANVIKKGTKRRAPEPIYVTEPKNQYESHEPLNFTEEKNQLQLLKNINVKKHRSTLESLEAINLTELSGKMQFPMAMNATGVIGNMPTPMTMNATGVIGNMPSPMAMNATGMVSEIPSPMAINTTGVIGNIQSPMAMIVAKQRKKRKSLETIIAERKMKLQAMNVIEPSSKQSSLEIIIAQQNSEPQSSHAVNVTEQSIRIQSLKVAETVEKSSKLESLKIVDVTKPDSELESPKAIDVQDHSSMLETAKSIDVIRQCRKRKSLETIIEQQKIKMQSLQAMNVMQQPTPAVTDVKELTSQLLSTNIGNLIEPSIKTQSSDVMDVTKKSSKKHDHKRRKMTNHDTNMTKYKVVETVKQSGKLLLSKSTDATTNSIKLLETKAENDKEPISKTQSPKAVNVTKQSSKIASSMRSGKKELFRKMQSRKSMTAKEQKIKLEPPKEADVPKRSNRLLLAKTVDVKELTRKMQSRKSMTAKEQKTKLESPKKADVPKRNSKLLLAKTVDVKELTRKMQSRKSMTVKEQKTKLESPKKADVPKRNSKLLLAKAMDLKIQGSQRGSPETTIMTKQNSQRGSPETIIMTKLKSQRGSPETIVMTKQNSQRRSPENIIMKQQISKYLSTDLVDLTEQIKRLEAPEVKNMAKDIRRLWSARAKNSKNQCSKVQSAKFIDGTESGSMLVSSETEPVGTGCGLYYNPVCKDQQRKQLQNLDGERSHERTVLSTEKKHQKRLQIQPERGTFKFYKFDLSSEQNLPTPTPSRNNPFIESAESDIKGEQSGKQETKQLPLMPDSFLKGDYRLEASTSGGKYKITRKWLPWSSVQSDNHIEARKLRKQLNEGGIYSSPLKILPDTKDEKLLRKSKNEKNKKRKRGEERSVSPAPKKSEVKETSLTGGNETKLEVATLSWDKNYLPDLSIQCNKGVMRGPFAVSSRRGINNGRHSSSKIQNKAYKDLGTKLPDDDSEDSTEEYSPKKICKDNEKRRTYSVKRMALASQNDDGLETRNQINNHNAVVGALLALKGTYNDNPCHEEETKSVPLLRVLNPVPSLVPQPCIVSPRALQEDLKKISYKKEKTKDIPFLRVRNPSPSLLVETPQPCQALPEDIKNDTPSNKEETEDTPSPGVLQPALVEPAPQPRNILPLGAEALKDKREADRQRKNILLRRIRQDFIYYFMPNKETWICKRNRSRQLQLKATFYRRRGIIYMQLSVKNMSLTKVLIKKLVIKENYFGLSTNDYFAGKLRPGDVKEGCLLVTPNASYTLPQENCVVEAMLQTTIGSVVFEGRVPGNALFQEGRPMTWNQFHPLWLSLQDVRHIVFVKARMSKKHIERTLSANNIMTIILLRHPKSIVVYQNITLSNDMTVLAGLEVMSHRVVKVEVRTSEQRIIPMIVRSYTDILQGGRI